MNIYIPEICGMGLQFTVDGFRILYGSIAIFMWIISMLFSKEYLAGTKNKGRYYFFTILTFFATEGVFFSADFYTTFLFFEIMSFASYVWVAQDEKKESLRAAGTYLAIAVIGGLVMLLGIFILYQEMGTLRFDELQGRSCEHLWLAGLCMLFGFGAKAGAFPLHIWLPKAHPVAPAPASALLSGILTKAGMFGILVLSVYLFAGNEVWGQLITWIGVCTMVVGAVLALFSVNLKRTLACSSVSQIGFILVGVGMAVLLGNENALAIRGSLLHMVNHSLIKLTLFLAAGAVYMNIHKLDLNEIRGFGRNKPLLHYIFLMGALGIGGVPLFNGYISKTLLHESIVEYGNSTIEWCFLISGGLTVAYMAKLYIAVFIEKNTNVAVQESYDERKKHYMNPLSATVLTISATILPILGFLPTLVTDRFADLGQGFLGVEELQISVSYFSLQNLKGAGISLVIGVVLYFGVVRLLLMKKEQSNRVYADRWNKYLDLENTIYRPILLSFLPFVFDVICRILDSIVDTVVVILRKTIYRDSKLPQEREEGNILTHFVAAILSFGQSFRIRVLRNKNLKQADYEHVCAIKYDIWRENETIVMRSMSFGLLLFCIGLILTVTYLFLRYFA